jgi:hypothetical protein
MEYKRNTYRILVANPERKSHLEDVGVEMGMILK